MPTVGTAGHVDHGKSALIEALCGTNPMHIPEEFRREMTIDLGFSFFSDDTGNPVGMIDVPGHERFVRNMVAGMSSLDLVLLVVAADEGWMNITTEHLQIIECLHLESLILVINKIDKVSSEQADCICRDAQIRISKRMRKSAPICKVSALNGVGIENLKFTILRKLKTISPPVLGKKPFFFVDRVFTIAGKGTVVAGTLRGGRLHLNHRLKLSSTGELVGIKSMQVCHNEVKSAGASSRVACNIRISGKTTIQRGDCLFAPEGSIIVGNNLLVQLDREIGIDLKSLKNHGETDIALGTLHAVGKIHFLNEQRTIIQMILTRSIPFFFGMRGVLFQPGNSVLLCGCRILSCCETDRKKKRRIVDLLESRDFSSKEEFCLFTEGFFSKEFYLDSTPQDVLETENYYVLREWLNQISTVLMNELNSVSGGLNLGEMNSLLPQVPREIVQFLLEKALAKQEVESHNELYTRVGTTDSLSPLASRLLNLAAKRGRSGLNPDEVHAPGVSRELVDLCRMKKLVRLDDNLYYERKTFNEICTLIERCFDSGKPFSIAEARSLTQLSRKYLIPILNVMQLENRLSRDGNFRRVILN